MIQKLLDLALRVLVRREVFIFLNLLVLVFCFFAIKDILNGVMSNTILNKEEFDNLNDSLDGLAGIMVAIGVFMEERETIQKIARSTPRESDAELNEIAHHNGLGILLVGLFMEIFTLLIESPRSLINVKGLENYLYGACILLIVCAAFICGDFVLDYLKSFKPFRKTKTAN